MQSSKPTDSNNKIEEALNTLERQVNEFKYSELRAVPVEEDQRKESLRERIRYCATLEATKKLYEMFETTFNNSTDPEVVQFCTSIARAQVSAQNNKMREYIQRLDNILSTFKSRIQEAEITYFKKKYEGTPLSVTAESCGTLNKDHKWLSVFQFMIEQNFNQIKGETPNEQLQQKYLPVINNMQKLFLAIELYKRPPCSPIHARNLREQGNQSPDNNAAKRPRLRL